MTSSILPTKDDDNGTIVGTVLMSRPAVGMAALTCMTAMKDRPLAVAFRSHRREARTADADGLASTEPKVRGSNPLGRAPSLGSL